MRAPRPADPGAPGGWQRSRFSGSGGGQECLEAAPGSGGRLRFRESDRPRTVLTPAPDAWAALLRAVRSGALDGPRPARPPRARAR
ncbi:DUF397 domain-containing protein [Streptomyces sp. NPDC020379]|uniref:DUF397 domain-containing protein n=1 Tax=Streptomyces sp. NPDC020379 TaxID=3365071 RepID=UPI00378F8E31